MVDHNGGRRRYRRRRLKPLHEPDARRQSRDDGGWWERNSLRSTRKARSGCNVHENVNGVSESGIGVLISHRGYLQHHHGRPRVRPRVPSQVFKSRGVVRASSSALKQSRVDVVHHRVVYNISGRCGRSGRPAFTRFVATRRERC